MTAKLVRLEDRTTAAATPISSVPPVPIVHPVSGPHAENPMAPRESLSTERNPWVTGTGAMLVRDVMTRKVVTTNPEATLRSAAQLLLRNHVSGLPVVLGTDVVGVLSEKDIVRVILSKIGRVLLPAHLLALFLEITAEEEARTLQEIQHILDDTPVSQAMTPHPIVIEADAPLEQATRTMIQRGVHRLPVVERGKLVGIITRDDTLRGSAGALDDFG
jgi:CBS domain-containing protein